MSQVRTPDLRMWAGVIAFAGGFRGATGRCCGRVAACRSPHGPLAGLGGKRVKERPDLGVGRVQCVAGDFFDIDLDPFEEGLVEEPTLGRLCLQVER